MAGTTNTRLNISDAHARLLQFLAVLILSMPPICQAAFEDLGIGARAPGMGNAFVAVADDISSVYYNPAGLAYLERTKLMASHSLLYTGLSDGSSLGLTNMTMAVPLKGGKAGTLGFLWNQFSLSGVYSEKTLQASYGFHFEKDTRLEPVTAGLSLKYLTHSFSRLEEAYNAMDGLNATGQGDPVLLGKNSVSALDLDAGLLYNITGSYSIGATVMNILQADVGFSGRDKVPMKTKIGAAYRALWFLMTSEVQVQTGPDGKREKDYIFAAEKIFPSITKGDIGARAALTLGRRQYKQIATGLSYKVNRVQFDYAFAIPLGTIKDTAGSHKLAMTYHFGSPTEKEQHAVRMLEQYRELKGREDIATAEIPPDLADSRIKTIKGQIDIENYAAANQILNERISSLLPDAGMMNLSKRLALVAAYYPALPKDAHREKWEEMLSAGIQNYLRANDIKAVKQISYAQAEHHDDIVLSNFLDKLEETAHIKADRVPSDFDRGYAQYKFQESDLLHAQKKYDDAIKRLDDILEFDPDNLDALKKRGSCNYLLGNYPQARKDWERALKKELAPKEKAKLEKMIRGAAKKGGGEPLDKLIEDENTLEQMEKNREMAEIDKLYRTGTELYGKGDYNGAESAFRKILALDPENPQAKKAIERIKNK